MIQSPFSYYPQAGRGITDQWPRQAPPNPLYQAAADTAAAPHNSAAMMAQRAPREYMPIAGPRDAALEHQQGWQEDLKKSGLTAQQVAAQILPQPMGVGGPQQTPANPLYNMPPTPKRPLPRGPGPIEWGADGNITWKSGDTHQIYGQR